MKTFLAVFTGSASGREQSGWDALDDQQRQAREQTGMQAWGDWMTNNGAALEYAGGPLGSTKRVARDGVADVVNQLAGFVIVRAESHEAAARMFERHPHFTIFPGDAVEVMECLPIPGA